MYGVYLTFVYLCTAWLVERLAVPCINCHRMSLLEADSPLQAGKHAFQPQAITIYVSAILIIELIIRKIVMSLEVSGNSHKSTGSNRSNSGVIAGTE